MPILGLTTFLIIATALYYGQADAQHKGKAKGGTAHYRAALTPSQVQHKPAEKAAYAAPLFKAAKGGGPAAQAAPQY